MSKRSSKVPAAAAAAVAATEKTPKEAGKRKEMAKDEGENDNKMDSSSKRAKTGAFPCTDVQESKDLKDVKNQKTDAKDEKWPTCTSKTNPCVLPVACPLRDGKNKFYTCDDESCPSRRAAERKAFMVLMTTAVPLVNSEWARGGGGQDSDDDDDDDGEGDNFPIKEIGGALSASGLWVKASDAAGEGDEEDDEDGDEGEGEGEGDDEEQVLQEWLGKNYPGDNYNPFFQAMEEKSLSGLKKVVSDDKTLLNFLLKHKIQMQPRERAAFLTKANALNSDGEEAE
jgi:hypothetical protein